MINETADYRLYVLGPMMFCYFIGGMAGSAAAHTLGPKALVVNLAVFAGTGMLYAVHISNSKHITLLKAIFSRGEEMPPDVIAFDDAYDDIENPMNESDANQTEEMVPAVDAHGEAYENVNDPMSSSEVDNAAQSSVKQTALGFSRIKNDCD